MQSSTSELLTHLEQSHAALRAAVDAVPAELREQQPGAERWSVAQVVEHLAHTAAQVAAMLERGLHKLERDGLRPAAEQNPVLPTLDTAKLLDRARPVAASDGVLPKNELSSAQALQVLASSREALVSALRAGDGIDVQAIRAPHPVLGDLGFHQWIAFVGLHEQRHAAQIRAVLELLPH